MADGKVMRLEGKEVGLIQFLRNTDKLLLLNELNSVYEKVPNIILEQIINILGDQNTSSLDVLVKSKLLTQSDANFLINCINNNKNIIITGSVGTGKTTLAKALLKQLNKEINVLIYENFQEFAMEANVPKLTLSDISRSPTPKRVVIGEIGNIDDAMALLTALDNGVSVLTTMQDSNWKNYIINLFNGSAKEFAQKLLDRNLFVYVEVNRTTDGERKAIVDKMIFTVETRIFFDEIIEACANIINQKEQDPIYSHCELSYVKAVFSSLLLDEPLLIDFVNGVIKPEIIEAKMDSLPIDHPSRFYLDQIKIAHKSMEVIQNRGLQTLYGFRDLIGKRIGE